MGRRQRNKEILWGVLFAALVTAVFFRLLRGQDSTDLRSAIRQVRLPWLGAAAGCMVGFFCCEAKNIQTSLALFSAPAPYPACLRYAFTGFFFSAITPSASGGQPMLLLALHRDGHGAAASALALLTEFFSFQLAAAGLALGGLLLHWQRIQTLDWRVLLGLLLGGGFSLAVTGCLCCAVFSRRILPALWRVLMRRGKKWFPRHTAHWNAWAAQQWTALRQCARHFRRQRAALGKMLTVSLLQLALLHSVSFWVCRAFGVGDPSPLFVTGMQAVLFFSLSAFPLPGAVGVSEGGFLLLYQTIYPAALLESGMLLSRLISFYLPLAASGSILALAAWRPAMGIRR